MHTTTADHRHSLQPFSAAHPSANIQAKLPQWNSHDFLATHVGEKSTSSTPPPPPPLWSVHAHKLSLETPLHSSSFIQFADIIRSTGDTRPGIHLVRTPTVNHTRFRRVCGMHVYIIQEVEEQLNSVARGACSHTCCARPRSATPLTITRFLSALTVCVDDEDEDTIPSCLVESSFLARVSIFLDEYRGATDDCFSWRLEVTKCVRRAHFVWKFVDSWTWIIHRFIKKFEYNANAFVGRYCMRKWMYVCKWDWSRISKRLYECIERVLHYIFIRVFIICYWSQYYYKSYM